MNKLNEKDIIKIFRDNFRNRSSVLDDVEYFKLDKKIIVIKVDTLVESTDVPLNTKITYVVKKSIVSCISDFAAKGVRPRYGIISVTIPRRFSKSRITKLASIIGKTANEFNIKMLGGDTNEGKELVLQIFLLGITKKIVTRKGSKVKDLIFTTGPFGYSTAGLYVILKNKKHTTEFMKKARNALLNPTSRLEFGITNSNYFTSSMDSSDGLSATLNTMSKQSKKKFVVTNLPMNNDLIDFARKNRLDVLDMVFNGGEEYEIVYTTNSSNMSKIKYNAKIQKIKLFEIGYVTRGKGVIYKNNNKIITIKDNGWIHFKN